MTGSDLHRIISYLESDRLGYQYAKNIARFAHVDQVECEAALQVLEGNGYVASMGDGDRRGWQITAAGVEWAGASS